MNIDNYQIKCELKRTEIDDLINLSDIKRCIMVDIIMLTLIRAGDKVKTL
jgi:hypothetical protein